MVGGVVVGGRVVGVVQVVAGGVVAVVGAAVGVACSGWHPTRSATTTRPRILRIRTCLSA
jgi:hypothetical protein